MFQIRRSDTRRRKEPDRRTKSINNLFDPTDSKKGLNHRSQNHANEAEKQSSGSANQSQTTREGSSMKVTKTIWQETGV